MMPNRKPCKRCQSTRKKCIWPNQQQHKEVNINKTNNNDSKSNKNDSCIRCTKLCVQCIRSDTKDRLNPNFEPEGTIDGQAELQYWQHQLHDIEVNLEKMKDHVQDLVPTNKNNNNKKLEWNLYIGKDGYVRLGTVIKSLDELLLYSQASMRYLSPFNGIFETEHIRLESSTASIAITSLTCLFRGVNNRQSRNRQHRIASTKPTLKAIAGATGITTATTMLDDSCAITSDIDGHDDNFYRSQMENLISLYLENINPIFGLLHEPSFKTYYESFDDPLDCPIALSLCVEASVMLRKFTNATSVESRQLADYFYYKSKDILTDIFDDPKRPLEAVMTITFLLSYLLNIRMNCVEARLYVTVSLLLCNQLEEQFNQYNDYGDNDDYDDDCQCKLCQQQEQRYQNDHHNNKKRNKNEMMMDPIVGKVMFQRHRLETVTAQRLIELFLYGRVDFSAGAKLDIPILDDEPKSVHEHYTVHNAMLKLFKTPYMSTMMKQVNQVMHGESSDLRLDLVLQFETVVREWWAKLPPELRSCEDPYKVDRNYMRNTQPQDSMKIAPFAILHLWTAVIHSSILKAHISSSSHDLIRMIQEKSALTAWNSCQAAVYALDKTCQIYGSNIMSTPLIHFDYLRLLYAVSNVITYENFHTNPDDMQEMLRQCNFIQEHCIPDDHRVPPGHSKLDELMASISSTFTHGNSNNTRGLRTGPSAPLNVYYEYPLPGLALISDLCSTAYHQLERLYYNSTYNTKPKR